MTTYVYETIPAKPGEKPRYFEIKQNMNASAAHEASGNRRTDSPRRAGWLRHAQLACSC